MSSQSRKSEDRKNKTEWPFVKERATNPKKLYIDVCVWRVGRWDEGGVKDRVGAAVAAAYDDVVWGSGGAKI